MLSYHHLYVSAYHAKTLLLFTKSDIKTTLIPVSILACTSAPLANTSRLILVIIWIWIHLLQFNISNQTVNPEEDSRNKPDRPLPAQRLTLKSAIILRYTTVPACFALSWFFSFQVLQSSVALSVFTFFHNECHAHRNFVWKNLLNAAGFACYETGSTLIAGTSLSQMDSIAMAAVCISTAVIGTTIQAQDFKDVDGDKLIGRQTLPLAFPTAARETLFVALIGWSIFLPLFWKLTPLVTISFMSLSEYVGWRYVMLRTSVKADQVSFYWYTVWLSFVHVLPVFHRILE